MKRVLLALLLISSYCVAQEDATYLEGAVPEIEGRVVFEKTFDFFQAPKDDVFAVALDWAQNRFKDEKNRIVYTNKETGDIAVIGEDYLVFSSTSLALDRSLMNYRLLMHCQADRIEIKVNGIKYEYSVSYQREPERYIAEEWITDQYAVNNGKLNRISGKFRKATIDYVNSLLAEVEKIFPFTNSITEISSSQRLPVLSQPVMTPEPVSRDTAGTIPTLADYKRINAETIPGNIIKLMSQDWTLITAGSGEEFNIQTAQWGGLGYLFGKPVTFCFINPTSNIFSLMQNTDTFTLTFYTEAYRNVLLYCETDLLKNTDRVKGTGLTPVAMPSGGKAFKEAWMIVECRKLLSQPLNKDLIINEELQKEQDKSVNTMFVGEIIGVWIK
ncbi:MAG: DUF4468 domain-containing protein [Massilibacteroides sp.]|nr:DUF4468 domain-containing protein [Massilibacteroides sp.]MDD3062252.1 DUF4468 domain-containing protein [Massilibacteroides sp.]MDD4114009.1 DUF4468 domain-containing protein [Massilibacteroides sp.]MDD4660025.1 DUF4468 domain-containing protein [Massilibacteroides sp.]